MDWLADLGAALSSGVRTGLDAYRILETFRDRNRQRELDEERIAAADRASSNRLREADIRAAADRFRTITQQQQREREQALANKQRNSIVRAALGLSPEGQRFLEAAGADADLGAPEIARDLVRLFAPKEPKAPGEWKPTTREEWESAERFKASLRPRASRGETDDNTAPSTAKALRDINTMIDNTRALIGPLERNLDAHQKLVSDAALFDKPAPVLNPADTSGLGAARRRLSVLSDAEEELTAKPLMGQEPNVAAILSRLFEKPPAAPVAVPSTRGMTFGPPSSARDWSAVRAMAAQEADALKAAGVPPDEISRRINAKYGTAIMEYRRSLSRP